MKKIYFIVVLSLYFLLPTDVFASMSASMDCPAGASPGQTITCTVKGNSNPELMSGLEASIQYSGNLEFISIANVAGWNGTSNQSKLLAYRDTGFTGTQSITTITVKISASATGTASITLNNVYASDSDANGVDLSQVVRNITIYSTNNNLASLSVDDVAVSGFNAGTVTYNLGNVNKSTLKISGTLADATASFAAGFGPRTVNLNYGTNIIQLKVTSQSGSTKVYSVQVNRVDNRNSNNNLASLSVSGGTIAFSAGTTTYNVTVDSATINISAAVADAKASFVAGFGPRTVNLNYGNNVVEIKVIAENQAIKVYTLNIKRSDARNSDNTLKTLKVDKGKIEFDPKIIAYNVSVEYDVTEVKVTADANNSKAKVEIVGGKDLVVGKNTITIKVTAENQTIKTYTVTIIRLNEGEKLPTTTLSNIEVKGYKIPFNSDKSEYDLKIGSENKLNLNITAEDPGTLIKVLGNDNLQDGSKIYIIAVSRDGNVKENVINIEKNEIPLFSILAVIGAVIITSLFWFGISKKKDTGSHKYELSREKKESNTINEPKLEEVKVESITVKEPKEEVKPENIIEEEIKEKIKSESVAVEETNENHKSKFFDDPEDEQIEILDESAEIVSTNIFEVFLPTEQTEKKENHGKICPNCKMVNDEKNSTCFFCKTELK